MIDNVFIQHGYFGVITVDDVNTYTPYTRKGEKHIPLPMIFRHFLKIKFIKFGRKLLEFTVGHDPETHLMSIAVVHPKDHFCRKIGQSIVRGRIKRMRGDMKKPRWINDAVAVETKYQPYNKPYPPWIYKLEKEERALYQ